VCDEYIALTSEYEAQNGEDVTDEDLKQVNEVMRHEVKAYRGACYKLVVQDRAAVLLLFLSKTPEMRKKRGSGAGSKAPPFWAFDSVPAAADFIFPTSEAVSVSTAAISPNIQQEGFMPPPSSQTFNFSMPSHAPTLDHDVSTEGNLAFKVSPFIFGESKTTSDANELELSTEVIDTDASESDDTTSHSDEEAVHSSPDLSVTEEQSEDSTAEENKDDMESCVALVKYRDSLLPTTAVVDPLLSHQQSFSETEDSAEPEISSEHTVPDDMLQTVLPLPTPNKAEYHIHLSAEALRFFAPNSATTIAQAVSDSVNENTVTPAPDNTIVLRKSPTGATRPSLPTPHMRIISGHHRSLVQIGISPPRESLDNSLDPLRTHTYVCRAHRSVDHFLQQTISESYSPELD
jgi:hypothetical protein